MTKKEQTLDDLLDDPMIQLVMARDGWRGEDVRTLLQRARRADELQSVPQPHVIAEVCRHHGICC